MEPVDLILHLDTLIKEEIKALSGMHIHRQPINRWLNAKKKDFIIRIAGAGVF
jgi:hypothetical protein